MVYSGHVSGVIDADEDGLGDLADRRPLYRDADRLAAVQKEARRLGYRAFARRTGLPESVAKRAANGRSISSKNVDGALEALRADVPARLCALVDCDRASRATELPLLLQVSSGPCLPPTERTRR